MFVTYLFTDLFSLQEKFVRAMFSQSLMYPARPVTSLLDGRLVLPTGAPPVAFLPAAAQSTSMPLFPPPPPMADSAIQIGRRAAVVDDQRCRMSSPVAAELTPRGL